MKAEAGTGEENSSPKKSSPSPTKKEGNAMPMPGESSGRLQCTKEGTVGKHIFKAWRPDNHSLQRTRTKDSN